MLAIPAPGWANSPPVTGSRASTSSVNRRRPLRDQVRRQRCLAGTRRRRERERATLESDRARVEERETLKRGGDWQHLSEQQALPAPGRALSAARNTASYHRWRRCVCRVEAHRSGIAELSARSTLIIRRPSANLRSMMDSTASHATVARARPPRPLHRRQTGCRRPVRLGDARAPAVRAATSRPNARPRQRSPRVAAPREVRRRQPRAPSFISSSPRSSSCEQRSQRSSSISCSANAVLDCEVGCRVPDGGTALQRVQHPCPGRIQAVIHARLEIQDDSLHGERTVHDVLRKHHRGAKKRRTSFRIHWAQ